MPAPDNLRYIHAVFHLVAELPLMSKGHRSFFENQTKYQEPTEGQPHF